MKCVFVLLSLMTINAIQAQEYSYVWANQYPAIADPSIVCCYDFDGDMTDDDQNGNLMASLGSLLTTDFQLYIDSAIIDNAYVRVWRWDQLPASDGTVQLSILLADVTNPGISLQDRIDGNTQVFIDPTATSIFTGSMTGGNIDLYAASSESVFFVPLLAAGLGSSSISSNPKTLMGAGGNPFVYLPLNEARIGGSITQSTGGCQGVCSETIVGTDPTLLGALEVSGLIHHADEIDALNALAETCSCAGIIPGTPLLNYLEDNSSLTVSCNYNNLDQSQCTGIPFCESIESPCDFAAISASFYDQDTNNNGVADSKSVGGLLGISGATVSGVVDLIFSDDFE